MDASMSVERGCATDDVGQYVVEVLPGAGRRVEIAVAEDCRARGRKAVIAAERREQALRRGHLRILRHIVLEVADEVDADRVVVLSVAVCPDRVHRAPLLDGTVLADDKW